MTLLSPGDHFPTLTLDQPGGESLSLPDDLAGGFSVVLFFRGSWCPFCNAQLKGFDRAHGDLEQLGAKVVALSVDDEETTQALIDKYHLSFPVGHSADAAAVSAATGAFTNPDPVFVQSTGFVLDPEGNVVVSSYSSGAIGRLTPEDTVGLIGHVKSQSG